MKLITVIGSAGFMGVMLAISSLIPFFYLAGPTAFEEWFAAYFVFFLAGVFITSLPAFGGSIALMRRSAKGSHEHRRWRNTLLGLAFVYGVTMAVHLPINISFWSFELSDAAITANLGLWSAAHLLRIAGALYASVNAFRAVAPSNEQLA